MADVDIVITPEKDLSFDIDVGSFGTRDYNQLSNKPKINGVQLLSNLTSSHLHIVSENTRSGWESNPNYIPKRGEICIYFDDDSQTVPDMKIGDGNSYIVDLPFQSHDAVRDILLAHANDNSRHVTQSEKDFWNAKLNYAVDGENLTFNRN